MNLWFLVDLTEFESIDSRAKGKVKNLVYTELKSAEMLDNFVD
ncbi:hypothetical protein [Rheinheimera mangrovi]|jgi:hypothetical protein|nr:hypothetical protein [Rheinheimera mangrovi]